MKSLAFSRGTSGKQTYLVLLHSTLPCDPNEWLRYLKELDSAFAAVPKGGRINTFVATDGGSPNDEQRRQLAIVISREGRDALTHVFTTQASVRTVVTAFRWIAPPRAVAYQPTEFPAVCEKCGVAPTDVLADFARTQASFQEVKILAQLNSTVPAATPAASSGQ